MTPTNVGSTRPTDATIARVLREMTDRFHANIDDGTYYEEETDMANKAYAIADALEAAGAEPPPLAHITTIRELFDLMDYDFDGSGLTVTDRDLLANTIANTFPTLKNDMPQYVTAEDKTGSLHRPDCSPDCSTHHRMTNDGQLGDGTDGQDRESYSDTQDRKSYTPTEV